MAGDAMRRVAKRILGPRNVAAMNRLRREVRENAEKRRVKRSKSYSVQLDITNSCNLRCTFCPRSILPAVAMAPAEFDCIMARVHKNMHSLLFGCGWEFSLSKHAAEILAVLSKYHVRETIIYTNGNILLDDVARAVVDARVGKFVVSIGEARKPTYERIRRGGDFDRVIANIQKLIGIRDEAESRYPVLCANMVVMNSNIGEMPDFVELAREVGIQEIRGRHLILSKDLDLKDEVVGDTGRANSIIELASEKAAACGIRFSVPHYGGATVPKKCLAPWSRLYIASNGDVSVCPRIHRHVTIGNLLREDLDDAIGSDEMRKLREEFDSGCFSNPVCSICMENRESEVPIDQSF